MKLESSARQNGDVLDGLRIIVTRPMESASALSEPLRALGATPIEIPVIRFQHPDDEGPLVAALDDWIQGKYDWVIFTSVNGVKYVWERLSEQGISEGHVLKGQIAAIGPATARALKQRGISVDYVPDVYVAEEIIQGLGDVTNKQILLPRADIARKALPNLLRDSGALVNEVVAYQTVEMDLKDEKLDTAIELIEQHEIDWLTFTSSSTVVHFMTIMERAGVDGPLLRELRTACIGPITEKTARTYDLNVKVVASQHDIPGLVDALVNEVTGHL